MCLFFSLLTVLCPVFSHLVHKPEHDAVVFTPKISPWSRKRGILDDEYSKSFVCPSYTEWVLLVWICIQVRVLFTGEGKGKEGYFSFPSCISSRTRIGTEGWAVSPGISMLSLAWVPRRETCQGHPFATTHMSAVSSNKTKHPRDRHICPSAATDLPQCPTTPPLLFFTLLQIPTAAKFDVPMTLWHCRNHSGCPEKRLWKQMLADDKWMQCYHIFEYPRLLSLYVWCTDDTTVSTIHGSGGSLVSDLWENINVMCAVWDRSQYKRGLSIWVTSTGLYGF